MSELDPPTQEQAAVPANAGWPSSQPAPPAGQMPQPSTGWQPGAMQQAWPPPVWPPPVATMEYQTVIFPFRWLYMKVKGNVADFREGSVGLDPGGVTITGRCQPRAEIYQTVMVLAFLFTRLGCIIAHLIMRYAMLRPEQIRIPWQQVRQVVLQPKRRRACVVYEAPNYAGQIKMFNLAFRLPQAEFDSFSQLAKQCGPEQTSEGRLVSGTSIVVWVLLIALLGVVAITALRFLGGTAHTNGGV